MEEINKAIGFMDDGNTAEALQLLGNVVQTATDEEKFAIYELYYEWGFFEKAVSILEDLLALYPGEGELIVPLTEMYIELKRDDEAIELLNQIGWEDPFYLEGLLHLADMYQTQGLFEVAEQKLLEAKKIAPDEMIIDFALGEFLFSIGQANRAIPFYKKVLEEEEELNGVDITERLAECHASIGHYEEALHYFGEIKTENPDTLFKYGLTAKGAKRLDIAIKIWQKLISLDPHYHSVYPELARVMQEENLIKDAFAVAKKGLIQDEYNKELYLIAGQLAAKLQKKEAAFTYLKEAVALDLDYQEAVLLLIELYKDQEQQGQIIDLITSIQKDMGANDPMYDWELAKAFAEVEQFTKAMHAYRRAADHLTHNSDFLKEYGYFLTEEGLPKEAIKVLEKYVAINPFDEDVLAFTERLKHANDQ